ncbi:MAG: glycosyltransferase [Pseudomonadota bacterium]
MLAQAFLSVEFMPKVLFVHNGAPGRFTHLARALLARGWDGALINGPTGTDIAGLDNRRFPFEPPAVRPAYRPVERVEQALLMGRGAARVAERLKAEGFAPDLIIGHPGWGEMLYLDEVFRGVPQIQLGEYYYHTEGADSNFDPEFPARLLDSRIMVVAQNAHFALSYVAAAAIVVPTPFQASLIPHCFQGKVRVIHEGIDTAAIAPTGREHLKLADGTVFDGSFPVISFANRRFEPIRGVHVFLRMLPLLFELVPDVRVLMIGADDPGTYGLPPAGGGTWLQAMRTELAGKLDWTRVHVLPPLPHKQLHRVFSNTTAHVYLTYPFVLSWSLLEAMACEAVVVGSDTAPVRDAIRHGENGVLVDFFDAEAMAQQLAAVCRDPARFAHLRPAARASVVRDYDRAAICDPAWMRLIDEIAGIPVS